jgi:hypothetical protein
MAGRRWKWLFPLPTLTLLIITPVLNADLYWESDVVSEGVSGQADGTRIGKYYYTPSGCRTEVGDTITIMDYKTGAMVVLNTRDKTYQEMIPREMPEEMDKEEQAFMKEMMKGMMGTVEIIPTNETQSIAGYDCQKYIMTFMGLKNDYWLSKDLEEYEEFKTLSEKMVKALEKNPMLRGTNVMGMMEGLDGFPVMTVQRSPGGGSVTTMLKRIESKKLTESLLAVPEGYTLKKEEMSEPAMPQQTPEEMPEDMPEDIKKMLEQMMKRSEDSQE